MNPYEQGIIDALSGKSEDRFPNDTEASDQWQYAQNYVKRLDQFAIHAPLPPKEIFDHLVSKYADAKDMTTPERNAQAYADWAYIYAKAMEKARELCHDN